MKRFGRILFLIFLLSSVGLEAIGKPSNDPELRAQQLGHQLRCPVCRGVPISDSPSELARQMMDIVRQQVASGKSDAEILKYFEERYGEWVLLEPKAEGMNLLVWILPGLVLLGGAAAIIIHLRKGKGNS